MKTKENFFFFFTDLMYPGEGNKLILIQDFTANFACAIKFVAFPFDIQVCNIILRLPSSYRNFVQISEADRRVSFTGTQELALFFVENVRHGPRWSDDQVHLQFELSCHGSSVVLSFFLPNIMLLVVSWASLFISWEAFAVRIMLSFGTLPVFYLLRLTLISSTPVTMAIKFMDVWIFFTALTLFANILAHIFLNDTDSEEYYMRNKPLLMRPAGGAVVITPESSKSSNTKPLHLYRLFILPIIVIIFNVTFWVMLFVMR